MSTQYAINIILDGHYKEENIQNILQKGSDKGFVYYDHILGERYHESPVLDSEGATYKVMQALKEDLDGGPSVYTQLDGSTAHLFFYRSEGGLIKFNMGSFSYLREKKFKENVFHVDFDYYIRMALDLCKDFAIIKLETDSF